MKLYHLLVSVFFFCFSVFSQNTIKLPENLIGEGIPEIKSSIVSTIEKYQSRSAGFMGWMPGKKIALIKTRFGEFNQLHLLNEPSGYRKQLTFIDWGVSIGSFHPLSTNKIVFVNDSAGMGLSQIFVLDIKDGSTIRVSAPKTRNVDFIWSGDGQHIAYRSQGRNGSKRQIYVVDPLIPSNEKLVGEFETGSWFPVDFSPDNRNLLVIESRSLNERYLWLFNIGSGQKKLIMPSLNNISFDGACFSSDGKKIYFTSDYKNDFLYLGYISLDDSSLSIKHLTKKYDWSVEAFRLSPDGKMLVFIINENGISKLHILDLVTNTELLIDSVPMGIITGLNWTDDSRELGFSLETYSSPGDCYSLLLKSNKQVSLKRWSYSETGNVDLSDIPAPHLINWKSFDNLQVSGFHYKPPVTFKGKRPVIIEIHGGPELQSRPGFLGGRNNFFLKELGIAILFPNIRGSAGYGKTFLKSDNGLKREDAFKDIGALLAWIKSQPDLDENRIMISGVSYGAGLTLAVSYLYNDRISCAWAGAPTSNYNTLLRARPDRRGEYGDERDSVMKSFFEKIAPINHASQIKKPIFILVGANDPITPPAEADLMLKELKNNGTTVWYLKALDEGHGFTKKANLDIATYLTVQFIYEYLIKDKLTVN